MRYQYPQLDFCLGAFADSAAMWNSCCNNMELAAMDSYWVEPHYEPEERTRPQEEPEEVIDRGDFSDHMSEESEEETNPEPPRSSHADVNLGATVPLTEAAIAALQMDFPPPPHHPSRRPALPLSPVPARSVGGKHGAQGQSASFRARLLTNHAACTKQAGNVCGAIPQSCRQHWNRKRAASASASP